MAQWLGQFIGKTHLSKVSDREMQLQHAVEVYGNCISPSDRTVQSLKVLRIAHRLLKARIKAQEAALAALDPRNLEQREPLERKLQQIRADGVKGVLREFGLRDVVEDRTDDE